MPTIGVVVEYLRKIAARLERDHGKDSSELFNAEGEHREDNNILENIALGADDEDIETF